MDTTAAHREIDNLAAAHTAEMTALQAKADTDLAEANRQITALTAEVAWFNERRATAHSVKPGETLWGISRLYSTDVAPITVQNLKDWNGLTSDTIEVDQLLRLQAPLRAPEPAPEPVPEPEPAPAVAFSVDISALGTDADLTEKQKVTNHKAILGVDNLQNVRVFFGARALSWTDARIQALTEKDSVLISTSSRRPRAELDAFLAATPERFRKRKGQVRVCQEHECEAEWSKAADGNAWLKGYLKANLDWAEALDASPWPTQSRDDVVKILLWYSQHIGRPSGGLRETKDTFDVFYGGQNFGIFAMDCYHYQVWLTRGRYATPEELFGKIVAFCRKVGRPCAIPEWGGELADGDTNGSGRAAAIKAGGEYLKANADIVRFANWWCAKGSRDSQTGVARDHHLELAQSNVDAFKALLAA